MTKWMAVCSGICWAALSVGCGSSTATFPEEGRVYVPVDLRCVDSVAERLSEIPEQDRYRARFFRLSGPSAINPDTSGFIELASAEHNWIALLSLADGLTNDCDRGSVITAT